MSLFMISREETIGGKGITREKINWGPVFFIVIGVIALAMIGTLVVSQFVLQGGETIRVSPMEERIGEKLAAGQALTAQEQAAFEKMKAEGVAAAKKFLQGEGEVAPVVSGAGLPPVAGTWKIQSARGELILVYRETASAKGKIAVSVDKNDLVIRNLMARLLAITTYRNGEAGLIEDHLKANQEVRLDITTPFPETGKIELWFQVNN